MTRFKKGTKVVCIEGFPNWNLETGGIYTIGKYYEGGMVLLEGDITIPILSSRFIPVSEIEPFAVKHNNVYELKELQEYGQSLGCRELGLIQNEEPHRVYFNLQHNHFIKGYFGTGSYQNKTYRELTFEQFKNNEHIMNTKSTETPTDCCGVSNGLVVSPEFVKEAHRFACAKWKKKIEDQFPSLFPKPVFKIGDRLKINGFDGPWLLAAVDYLECSIVNIDTGCHFGIPFSVKNVSKIEIDEIGMPDYSIKKA